MGNTCNIRGGSRSIIKRGTADSTINPSSVWYMEKNQSICGKYPDWYTTQDIELPQLAEAPKPTDPAEPQKCVECEKLREQLGQAELVQNTLLVRLNKIAELAAMKI
ncbi:MAG: hypothetical protein RR115_02575 [Hydrogenoanaerobacterium sp.]